MLSTRKDFGPHTMSALFRAAILESNLSQSIFLLQVATTLSLLPKIPKTLLIQLACYWLNKLNFGQIQKSTLHCYSYLTNNHGEMIKDLIDDGLMIELLLLSSRHIKADLTLNVLSQLIKFQRKLRFHISFINYCALSSGDRMAEVIQILVRVGQDLQIGSEENEVIGFNLIVGHLGGLHKYRSVMQNNSKEDNGSIEEEEGEQQESDKPDLELGNHMNLYLPLNHITVNHLIPIISPSSFIFNPDHLTLTLLKNIAEQVPQNHHHHQIVHDQILEIINHFQN
ncbi:hypothetical protein PSTT_06779 [Puccinia striiformis]|uniref:Uncharacterized protein n=1 Tax=Puccinia striiformis TaxID=27350 RepID=A0A2S4VIS9_9BASI|nr:hypothetical protein PSTT_06779 [Puccinia striiformis]